MPKSIKKRNLKGGDFWDPIRNTWNSITYEVRNLWNNTKKNDSSQNDNYFYSNNNNSYATPSSSYYSSNNYTRGGKKKKITKGGYSHPTYPNLASQAGPYHGSPTASVKWIGGKKRRKTIRKRKEQ
jgi:hypothetical protein